MNRLDRHMASSHIPIQGSLALITASLPLILGLDSHSYRSGHREARASLSVLLSNRYTSSVGILFTFGLHLDQCLSGHLVTGPFG